MKQILKKKDLNEIPNDVQEELVSLHEQTDMLKKENNELEQLVELLQDEEVVTFAVL